MEATSEDKGWPPRPEAWPDVMTDIEVCQYLRLDEQHATPATAKRSLRFIRRTQGLPSLGRICSKVLFRKSAVGAWLAKREQANCGRAGEEENDEDLRPTGT